MYRRVHNINNLIPTDEITAHSIDNDNKNKEHNENTVLYKIDNFFTELIPIKYCI